MVAKTSIPVQRLVKAVKHCSKISPSTLKVFWNGDGRPASTGSERTTESSQPPQVLLESASATKARSKLRCMGVGAHLITMSEVISRRAERAKPRNVAIGRLTGPSAERPGKGERPIVDDPGQQKK